MSLREPTPAMIRERLHLATRQDLVQKFIYVTACRVSEATDPRYKVEARDLSIQEGPGGEEFLVINLRTAKRSGLPRSVASSMKYDPLARAVWEEVQALKVPEEGPIFHMNPRTVERAVEATFWGLSYPITVYRGADGQKIDHHWRIFNVHALRHLRATELSQHYGFTGEDLARFLGWTMSSARMSNMIERYEIYNWRKYSDKLLRPPPWSPINRSEQQKPHVEALQESNGAQKQP